LFVKASSGVKHCGDSSDDYEFHFLREPVFWEMFQHLIPSKASLYLMGLR